MAKKKMAGGLPKVAKGGILTSKSIKKNLIEQTGSYLNKRLTTFIGEIATFRNKQSGFVDVRAWTSYWNANHPDGTEVRIDKFEESADAQRYAVEVLKFLVKQNSKSHENGGLKFGTIQEIDDYYRPIHKVGKSGRRSFVGYSHNPFENENLKKSKNGRYGYTEYHPLLASKYIGWVDAELDVLAHAVLLDSACGMAKKIMEERKRFNELFFAMFGEDNYIKAVNCIKHAYDYVRESAIGINGSMAEDFVGTEEEQYNMLSKYKEANLLMERDIIHDWQTFKDEYRPERLKR